ncbi:MAG: exodeoxyribonuclease-3 [Flavobacteriales bacterium]|jgi:exodeoxyribonuclease-3
MRIISLCVDGIHQAAQRGLYEWLATQDADIICLQDLRALEPELDHDIFHPKGYFAYFFDSGVKHYNGVAIYTRHQPKALIYGLGFSSGVDMEGRYLQIDYEGYSIGSLLAPQAFSETESMDVKDQFFDDMQALLHKITRKRRSFILCGNWGMAHAAKDVENSSLHEGRSGFLEHEQKWMDQLFRQLGYADAFRQFVPDGGEYSWAPDDGQDAMRIDYHVVSSRLSRRIENAAIYKTQSFSSHRPVIVDYDIDDLVEEY